MPWTQKKKSRNGFRRYSLTDEWDFRKRTFLTAKQIGIAMAIVPPRTVWLIRSSCGKTIGKKGEKTKYTAAPWMQKATRVRQRSRRAQFSFCAPQAQITMAEMKKRYITTPGTPTNAINAPLGFKAN